MSNRLSPDLQSLPKPAQGRGGMAKLGMYTLLALVLTSAGLYWLSRDEEDKRHMTSAVKENVEKAVKDTPLQGVIDPYLENTSSLPATIVKPSTAPGTLAGQNVQAKMSAPPSLKSSTILSQSAQNTGLASGHNAGQNTFNPLSQENAARAFAALRGSTLAPSPTDATPIAPKVTQDNKVPLSFVDDMANWLVTRYKPKGGITRNLSTANLRYGQKMHTLLPQGTGDVQGARASLLRYAFNSSMMTALYNLYADRFVQSMTEAAQSSSQNKNQTSPQHILQSYASDFNTLGAVLQGLGAMNDFEKRMQAIENSVSETLQIHNKLTEAIFAFDNAVEEKKSDVAKTLQLRIDSLNAQYQRSLHNRTLATESLMGAIRQQAPAASRMDNDSILFLAQWLERRKDQGQNLAAVQESAATAGSLLQDLASKLQMAPSS